MQVRVFESEDMTSGLQQIRRELGPDALILSTKSVRNGKFGLIGKPMVEITAAIDTAPATPSIMSGAPNPATFTMPNRAGTKKTSRFSHVVDENLDGLLAMGHTTDVTGKPLTKVTQRPCTEWLVNTPTEKTPSSPPNPSTLSSEPEEKGLHTEIRELRNLVSGLSRQVATLTDTHAQNASPSRSNQIKIHNLEQAERMATPLQGDSLLRQLTKKGIQAETARTIAGFLRDSHSEEELLNKELLSQSIVETVESLIEVADPELKKKSGQKRIAFVGPTGVGKTTTLAKICAHYLSTQSKSVALITIDTYRIAAVEQLKVYGEIMGLPVDVVFTPEQLDEAFRRHQDKELILIDTAGRSPRDDCHIDELAAFLRPGMGIDKHLVLSASTREQELLDTIEKFGKLELQRTIFTKLDECFTLGVLLNIQLQNPTPLSWLTNGQRVPEDLLHITPRKVAELIMFDGKGTE